MTTLDTYGGWPGVLATLAAGRDISASEARAALGAILAGEATDAQVAAFIVALRLKGPAVGELLGLVGAMRDAATPLDVPAGAIDIVGTGGTAGRKAHALNVSTMACFVAAGAGATVCKHGSVKASSTSGSFDLLEAIGVPIAASPQQVADMVRTAGLGFAFAKTFHPAMRHVAGVRSQVGISTVFNLLGPLSHPGHVQRQVLGVLERSLAPTMAAVLQATGSVRSLVVHGDGRFDELSTTGPNLVVDLNEGKCDRVPGRGDRPWAGRGDARRVAGRRPGGQRPDPRRGSGRRARGQAGHRGPQCSRRAGGGGDRRRPPPRGGGGCGRHRRRAGRQEVRRGDRGTGRLS